MVAGDARYDTIMICIKQTKSKFVCTLMSFLTRCILDDKFEHEWW